jgi:hypothetical protein
LAATAAHRLHAPQKVFCTGVRGPCAAATTSFGSAEDAAELGPLLCTAVAVLLSLASHSTSQPLLNPRRRRIFGCAAQRVHGRALEALDGSPPSSTTAAGGGVEGGEYGILPPGRRLLLPPLGVDQICGGAGASSTASSVAGAPSRRPVLSRPRARSRHGPGGGRGAGFLRPAQRRGAVRRAKRRLTNR